MTQINTTKTTPLNAYGAQLFEYRNSNGADTPPALRAAGILSENSYTCTRGFNLRGPIAIQTSSLPGSVIQSHMHFATAGWQTWDTIPQLSNIKALSNLLEKFKQSDFNLAVTAGESRESWHMISDRMFKFAEGLRRTRRGDLSGALRALGSSKRVSRRAKRKLDSGDVSGSFLELQYGWIPLMGDIYSASELIGSPKLERSSIRTSVHLDGNDRVTSLAKHQSDSRTFKNERSAYHIAKLSTKEISMAVRLGLTNPLSIVWELTTLSFVADWFLPIGDLIQAVEASYIIPTGKYIKTDVLRQHSQLALSRGDHCWGVSNSAIAASDGLYVSKGITMTRTVGDGNPSNIFDNAGPRESLISMDLSMRRAASASALLHQAFKAFRR